MTSYAAYLEIADDGRCLAHVLDLPGLVVRDDTRDRALRRLPDAINRYHAWLGRHGEPVPSAAEAIEIEIAGESHGFGPFERRSTAALFPPDRAPLTLEEMEQFFRFLDHSRADLLALTHDLPGDLLDWQSDPESFSLRELLRHVGNAEKWYVSRLVPLKTLPQEWQTDQDLSIFEFLAMVRRTSVARLRKLNEEERSEVFCPSGWNEHPEEPWTARKVLRRFLEHELEHTQQTRHILSIYRQHLLVRLASERAGLLEWCLGLDERTLTRIPVAGDWTVREVLAHIAAWDRWQHRTMRSMVAGIDPDLAAEQDFDAANTAFVAEWADATLDEVVHEVQAARSEWATWLEGLPLKEFFRRRSYGGDDWSFYAGELSIFWQHEAEHAQQIAAGREAEGIGGTVGPRTILLAALDAARDGFRAAASLVPAEDRDSRPVCGQWTLKDLLGHIADWEAFGAEGLGHMATGQPPRVEYVRDIDAWNQAHVLSHQAESWEQVVAHLDLARQVLRTLLERMSEADLARSFPVPWGGEGTPYGWVSIYVTHDREHARDVESECLNVP